MRAVLSERRRERAEAAVLRLVASCLNWAWLDARRARKLRRSDLPSLLPRAGASGNVRQ